MLSFSISFWDVIKSSYLAERPLKKGIEGEREGDFTDNFNVKHWQKFQPLLYPAEIRWISWPKKSHMFWLLLVSYWGKHPIINPSIDDLVAGYWCFPKPEDNLTYHSKNQKYHIELSNFNNPWLNLFSIISILKH